METAAQLPVDSDTPTPVTEANSAPMMFLTVIACTPDFVDTATTPNLLAMNLRDARDHFERVYMTQQLEIAGGSIAKLAKIVGMERTHVYRKLRILKVRS